MARRIARLTPGFRRAIGILRIVPGSARRLALAATISALARDEILPGAGDFVTEFRPGHAHVRRIGGHNLWILYRFDDVHLDVLAVRDAPPVPSETPTS